MFQRIAEQVAAIPVESPSVAPAAAQAEPPRASQPPLVVQVVDALDMPAADAAGLRRVVDLIEPRSVAGSEATRAGLRAAVTLVADRAAGRPIQLGAFPTEEAAREAWRRLSAAHPAALGGLKVRFEPADLGSKGSWIRVKAGPVSPEQASPLCVLAGADPAWCAKA